MDIIIQYPKGSYEEENMQCNAIYHIKNNMYTTYRGIQCHNNSGDNP
jgi:hypothetical protein